MGYVVPAMSYFGVDWPLVLGYLALQVLGILLWCFGGPFAVDSGARVTVLGGSGLKLLEPAR